MRIHSFSVGLLCSFATFTAIGQVPDRLFPSSAANNIFIKFSQDGKAIDVQIKNNSNLILTGGILSCDVHDKSYIDEMRFRENNRTLCYDYHLDPAFRPQEMTYSQIIEYKKKNQKNLILNECKAQPFVSPTKIKIKDISTSILPGTIHNEYIEAPPNKIIQECEIIDPRGRSKKWYEF